MVWYKVPPPHACSNVPHALSQTEPMQRHRPLKNTITTNILATNILISGDGVFPKNTFWSSEDPTYLNLVLSSDLKDVLQQNLQNRDAILFTQQVI